MCVCTHIVRLRMCLPDNGVRSVRMSLQMNSGDSISGMRICPAEVSAHIRADNANVPRRVLPVVGHLYNS